jgi:hypothetical protein
MAPAGNGGDHSPLKPLSELNLGFRNRYLDHQTLGAQLRSWAETYPQLVRRQSLGDTPEGRDIELLVVGPDPERKRPAVWIDANMHASELCGSSVALAIAEDVIAIHLGQAPEYLDLPEHVLDHLREMLFYVLPRMSPDGAEAVLDSGRFVRSLPRDQRVNQNAARWIPQDMDGDGLALLMRQQDACGEFVANRQEPGLLVQRSVEDSGPFYKVYPEGVIENFDGYAVPDSSHMSGSQTDLNRNFPWSWAPEHQQHGAGPHPMSEPESRAVVDFACAHPNIFVWLNLHSYGGVFIRPLGDQPDSKMNREDLAIFRQIEAWNKAHTGYPTVSGFEEFTYEPETPLCGDLTEFAYHHRGCIAYVCELWDLFRQIGVEPKKRFVDHYAQPELEDLLRLCEWDRRCNDSRLFQPWRPYRHPQLGAVEIGGVDPRIGLWNPPYDRITEICQQQSTAFLRVAAMGPRIAIAQTRVRRLGSQVSRLEVAIENHGYLGSYGLPSAKKLDWNEPLYAELSTDGCELAESGDARREIGHLDGWGHGLHAPQSAPQFMRSRGSSGSRALSWTLTGTGVATIRVGSCRVGWIEERVKIR